MERLCGCATSKSLTFIYLFIYLFIYFLYIQDNTCTFEGTWKIWGPLWVLYFLSEGSYSLRAISCYPVNISISNFTRYKWKCSQLFLDFRIWRTISSMRRSVSSPHETTRRESKMRRAVEYFCQTSSVDETLCRMLNITSQTKWF